MCKQSKTSIVFAHGIWADGSSFSQLIPTLQHEGHEVIAAQYGLDSLAGDVSAVKSSLALVWRHTHNGRRDRSAGGWARLHCGTRAGRRRNVAEPAGTVSRHGRFLTHRGSRRTRLDEA